jgi:hypothetical protein
MAQTPQVSLFVTQVFTIARCIGERCQSLHCRRSLQNSLGTYIVGAINILSIPGGKTVPGQRVGHVGHFYRCKSTAQIAGQASGT